MGVRHSSSSIYYVLLVFATLVVRPSDATKSNNVCLVDLNMGSFLLELQAQMEELAQVVQAQALNIDAIRKGMDERFEKMDQKIEWAITDGTLAPTNVSEALEKMVAVDRKLSDMLEKASIFQETAQKGISDLLARPVYHVKLLGGPSRLQGRLMVRETGGEWGTVCDDDFETNDARVVCRMLGYRGPSVAIGSFSGPGTGPIHLDNVQCLGSEESIFDCPSRPWGSHNCQHEEDISIKCGED